MSEKHIVAVDKFMALSLPEKPPKTVKRGNIIDIIAQFEDYFLFNNPNCSIRHGLLRRDGATEER